MVQKIPQNFTILFTFGNFFEFNCVFFAKIFALCQIFGIFLRKNMQCKKNTAKICKKNYGKINGKKFGILLHFYANRYFCFLSTTSLKIALFMDNKLRLNIAGPGQEINVPECFEIDRRIEIL